MKKIKLKKIQSHKVSIGAQPLIPNLQNKSCREFLKPKLKQVAIFESPFHQYLSPSKSTRQMKSDAGDPKMPTASSPTFKHYRPNYVVSDNTIFNEPSETKYSDLCIQMKKVIEDNCNTIDQLKQRIEGSEIRENSLQQQLELMTAKQQQLTEVYDELES